MNLVQRLQDVPYLPGGGDWSGCDCWGLVELWYRERFGIELSDRGNIAPGPEGLQQGFANSTDWLKLYEPQNDDLVVMRRGRLSAGHMGVFWNGSVLHTDKPHGCVLQPVRGRQIAPRITCFLRRRSFV